MVVVLARPDDVRRTLHGTRGLFDDRCELCDEEERAARSGPGSSQRRWTRGKA